MNNEAHNLGAAALVAMEVKPVALPVVAPLTSAECVAEVRRLAKRWVRLYRGKEHGGPEESSLCSILNGLCNESDNFDAKDLRWLRPEDRCAVLRIMESLFTDHVYASTLNRVWDEEGRKA